MAFDPSKPVQTRSGWPARILCTDRHGGEYPVVALVRQPSGFETCVSYRSGGHLHQSACHHNPYDLINAPEKIEGWINIERTVTSNDGVLYTHGNVWPSREEAKAGFGRGCRIACIHVSFEEGDGL